MRFSAAAAARVLVVAGLLGSAAAGVAPAARAAGAAGRSVASPAPAVGGEAGALAQARASGSPVPVPGDETATDTVTANADGTLTLTEASAPVRKWSGGKWKILDATLGRAADGTVAPAVTSSGLALSGGGTGPMATLRAVGKQLSLSFPVPLPAPSLSGATAVYADVLAGVDLRVTADAQGAVSVVLVVHDAAAAASPQLAQLALAVQAPGLTLAAGKAGDITAADGGGHVVFAAPTPFMWDSAPVSAATPAATDPQDGTQVDAHTGMPLGSSASGPGVGAATAPVGTAVQDGAIVLTPDQQMLTSAATVFPVYIDPTFNPPSGGSSRNTWTTVNNGFPNQSYWKTSGSLQVGYNGWDAPLFTARSFVNMPVPNKIYGATVISAQLNMTENWSPSCTATPVQAWLTGAIGSGTTWNSQPSWSSTGAEDSQTVAHGYNSSCPSAGVGFDVHHAIQIAADNSWTQTTFGLRAGNESDAYGWKQFDNTATMSVTYDHAPATPAGLTTSPATSCGASSPTIVGDGDVKLDVPVLDPDGGLLGVTLQMWKTSTGAAFTGTPTDPQKFFKSSGIPPLAFTAHKADLEAAAGGAVTEFSWKAQVTDYYKTSGWSVTCNFRFDPTRPGAPVVTVPGSATIGQPATITVAPPQSGTIPASYVYQLNADPPGTVTADASGNATITVVPARFTNQVTVTGLSPAGNYGEQAVSDPFVANPGTAAADADLTGDGAADLVTASGSGSSGQLAAGLWLAAGRGDGNVVTQASDFGANGNGTSNDYSPADFAGAQAITGHVSGTLFQDVLVYYPSGVPKTDGTGVQAGTAGEANVLFGTGDGSANDGNSGSEHTIGADVFTDLVGNHPQQLANAGDTHGRGFLYPDLIGITGGSLTFYPNSDGVGDYQNSETLTVSTPSGGTDWQNWQIATAQVPSGTAMYLWDPGTGALYLWTGLHYDDASLTLTYTQYVIADGSSSHWNTGAALTLHAADINGDGTADLWAVNASGVVTTYLATLGAGTGTLAAQPAQTLLAAAHAWPLNVGSDGVPVTDATAVTTAADTTGSPALPLTGTGNASWNTGDDAVSPDVELDGTNGALAAASPAVNPNSGGFTVSAWANPDALGGTVLSQDMSNTASFRLSSTTAGSWQFCLAETDAASPAWDCAAGGQALAGQWAQLTATYDPATTVVNLFQGTVNIGHTAHTALPGATNGAFQAGDYKNGASRTGYFAGQVSQVQTWNRVIAPTEISSPAGYYHPLPATRIFDSRPAGGSGGIGPVSTTGVPVLNKGGIPATGVTAVAMNVTVLDETANGILNIYPHQAPMPSFSDINYTAGQVLANFKIVAPGPDGQVAFTNLGSGSMDVLVDISGYFTASPAGASTFTPLTPSRILNTISGQGAPKAQVAAGSAIAVQAGGANGIPPGITAVAIDAEAPGAAATGNLVYYADGTSRPTAAGLQFHPDGTYALTAIVPVAANGKIDIYTTAATNIVADVEGYFTAGTSGEKFHAIGGTRLIDSRQHGGPLANGGTLPASAGTSVAAQNPALVANYVAIGGAAGGWLDVYAHGTTRGTGSIVDYQPSQVIDSLALSPSSGGTVDVYNSGGGGTTQAVVDCSGYFAAG
jgi:hypothetical protein